MRCYWIVFLALLLASPVAAESEEPQEGDGSEATEAEGDTANAESDEAGESEAPAEEKEDESGAEASTEEPAADEASTEEAAAEEASTEELAVEEAAAEESPAAEAGAEEAAAEEAAAEEAAAEEPAAEEVATAMPSSAQPPSLELKLPGEVTLAPVAQVQVRATLFDMDDPERNDPILYGDPGLREGISLRRVRLGMTGSWKSLLNFSVVGGFDNRYDGLAEKPSGIRLVEASFGVTPWKAFGLKAGLARVAFGRQATTSSSALGLWERSMASEHMAPDREPGVLLGGSLGPGESKVLHDSAFQWAVGVSNGGGDWTGDAQSLPRVFGRGSIDLGEAWQDVEAGWTPGGFSASLGGSISYNWGLEANELLGGVDLGIRVWRISLQGEVMLEQARPTFDTEGIPEILTQLDSMGWYGQLGVVLVPGCMDLAFRVGAYDDNTALEDAGDRLDIAGGLNFHLWEGRLKAQLSYVHREELTDLHDTDNDSLVLQIQARL